MGMATPIRVGPLKPLKRRNQVKGIGSNRTIKENCESINVILTEILWLVKQHNGRAGRNRVWLPTAAMDTRWLRHP